MGACDDSPPRTGRRSPWLRPWIGAHLAAARAGFLHGAVPELADASAAAAHAARADPRFALAARIARAGIALGLAGTALVLLTGGFDLRPVGLDVRMTSVGTPLRLVLVSSLAWLVLADIRRGSWPVARVLAATGRVPVGVRLALVLWTAAGVALLTSAGDFGRSLEKLADRGRAARSGVIDNSAHRHLRPLIGNLSHAPRGEPVAVYIDDVNPRGHLASFYAFPRLLCMDPATQDWSLRIMMWRVGGDDPAFDDPGERPAYAQSLEWARAHGLDLLVASPEGARRIRAGGEER